VPELTVAFSAEPANLRGTEALLPQPARDLPPGEVAIVRGEAEIYLHTGGQYEWDSCAPVAVAAAYGLHVSRVDGSPLVYNQRDTYIPDLLICRPEWATRVIDLAKA
jgi:hypothetical protein